MIWNYLQIGIFLLTLACLIIPLGRYMAYVFWEAKPGGATELSRWERFILPIFGLHHPREMTPRQYAVSLLTFSALSTWAVYGIQRCQEWLPWNPQRVTNVGRDSALNTAISFMTNTNWQGYSGEATMSYLTQSTVLTVQNFLSAAVGMAVLVVLVRGFRREKSSTIGDFYLDVFRATVYILLPLSLLFSFALVSQGVVQTWGAYPEYRALEDISGRVLDDRGSVVEKKMAVGPVASQVAIKQLGTNGGGFFNANSAHPFENPTPLSNLLQMVAILLIPASLCLTFGELIGDRRQGWALLAAMSFVFVPLLFCSSWFEQSGNPLLRDLGVDQQLGQLQSGGNMEGKEVRFGIVNSSIWSVATTAASNGSVNSMHDSYTPLGGMIPLLLIQLGEVIFGGVGSGLYGMVIFALVTVFIAGLMVGRTPEYLGKKVGAFEMKMVALAILLPCSAVLVGTAVSVSVEQGRTGIWNPGPHGFSEVLYALSSAGNNNGSAFAGLGANTLYYNLLLGLAMLIGRFGVILPVIGIAGSLARKTRVPAGAGTLATHTPLFVVLLTAIILLVGALSFLPSLALGPIAEYLTLISKS